VLWMLVRRGLRWMGVGRRGGLVTEEEEEEGWRPQYALSAIVCLLGAACCNCGTDMHSSSPLTCVLSSYVWNPLTTTTTRHFWQRWVLHVRRHAAAVACAVM
jgi:hypothetical protein